MIDLEQFVCAQGFQFSNVLCPVSVAVDILLTGNESVDPNFNGIDQASLNGSSLFSHDVIEPGLGGHGLEGVAHGGNLAESYRMLSTLLRDNMAFESELRAMTTEGRMQALVMSALPLVMIVLLGLVKRDLVAPLFTTGIGWGALGVLAFMQLLAYLWIRKIVDIKV